MSPIADSGGASTPLRTAFETADAEQLERYLREVYGPSTRIQGLKADASRHVRIDAESFAVDDLVLRAQYAYTIEVPHVVIAELGGGKLERGLGKDDDRILPGEVLMLTEPGVDCWGEIHGFDARMITIAGGALTAIAGEDVRFTGYRPLSPAAAQLWKRTVDYVTSDVLGFPEAAPQKLLLHSAARLLTATALTVFPNTVVHGAPRETAADRPAAQPALLRRALAFIDDNAHRAIGLADIATGVHLTPRALQYAFRQHLDTTPTAYLRRVRLGHAHRELVDTDPASGETVTTIARRWGFANPGRFAAEYRKAYGRSPSHTLKS